MCCNWPYSRAYYKVDDTNTYFCTGIDVAIECFSRGNYEAPAWWTVIETETKLHHYAHLPVMSASLQIIYIFATEAVGVGGRIGVDLLSLAYPSLAWPDPCSHGALSIRDDKRPREKGLVRFTVLTRSRTQHGGAGYGVD